MYIVDVNRFCGPTCQLFYYMCKKILLELVSNSCPSEQLILDQLRMQSLSKPKKMRAAILITAVAGVNCFSIIDNLCELAETSECNLHRRARFYNSS